MGRGNDSRQGFPFPGREGDGVHPLPHRKRETGGNGRGIREAGHPCRRGDSPRGMQASDDTRQRPSRHPAALRPSGLSVLRQSRLAARGPLSFQGQALRGIRFRNDPHHRPDLRRRAVPRRKCLPRITHPLQGPEPLFQVSAADEHPCPHPPRRQLFGNFHRVRSRFGHNV